MKNILLSCATTLLFISTQAQVQITKKGTKAEQHVQIHDSVSDRIRDKAEFIFEGIIQSEDLYRRPDSWGRNRFQASSIIKVTKVFRGNLKLGTVESVGTCDDHIEIEGGATRAHGKPQRDSIFIFFCRTNTALPYDAKYNIYPVDNKVILGDYGRTGSEINLKSREGLNYYGKNRFASLGAIYRYIGASPNVTMPVIEQKDTVLARFYVRREYHPSSSRFDFQRQQRLDSIENYNKTH